MAIGIPTSIGSSHGAANSTFLDLPVAAAVAAGQKIFVAVVSFENQVFVSDTKSNTYEMDVDGFSAPGVVLFSCTVTTPLTTSDIITADFTLTQFSRLMCAVQCSGVATISLDKASSASGTAVGWDTGLTSVTSAPDEIVISACANDSTANETSTPQAGDTELFDFSNAVACNLAMHYKIVSSTGQQNGAGTWTNSGARSWGASIATHEADVPPPPPPPEARTIACMIPRPKRVVCPSGW